MLLEAAQGLKINTLFMGVQHIPSHPAALCWGHRGGGLPTPLGEQGQKELLAVGMLWLCGSGVFREVGHWLVTTSGSATREMCDGPPHREAEGNGVLTPSKL